MEGFNLEEVPSNEKGTAFWVKYRNHHDEVVVTEKRSWIEHFMIDNEKNTGKTDFNYTLRIDEAPTTELRDWLESDVFVELHMTQPKFKLRILEEGQTEPVKDVDLDSDGKPLLEEKMLGVSSNG